MAGISSPDFITPSATIPTPVSRSGMTGNQHQTVSPSWLRDPMRYSANMTPPTGIESQMMVTPEDEVEVLHVSGFCLLL